MKKLIFAGSVFLLIANFSIAQTTKKPVAKPKTISKTTTPVTVLKTFEDSVSYACGISFANYYKEQGVKKINTTLLSRAVNDVLSGKNVLFNDETANAVMNKYMFMLQREKVKPEIDAGTKFLEENKKRPEVKTTASGLQYEVLREGTGPKPLASDSVTCNYVGTLLNGTEFDNSYKRGQPITFPLHGVIPGWTEGLQLMPVGSKYKFYVPYTLGYGEFGYGAIPGGATLVFEIELLGIKKGPGE